MRKLAAGLLLGLVAATTVLAIDAVFTAADDGLGSHPLRTIELKTYDWRLAATAAPATARKDIALIEIDEYSLRNLQPYFGRWPWPRAAHGILLDYLSRAPAKVIVYDVNFAEPDTKAGVQFGQSMIPGAESDQVLVDAVERAGNVVMLADATYEGAFIDPEAAPELPDEGYRLQAAGIVERRVVFQPFKDLAEKVSGFGHNLFVLDPDGPLRHVVPFVRSSGRAIPSLGVAGALRAAGIPPAAVRLEGDLLHIGDRKMPLSERRVQSADGASSYKWGLINFRGPALLEDLKSRPYASYAFWDLFVSEDQILRGETPNVNPEVFENKLVFVGVTASGLYDVFETPFAGGRMPGIQIHAAAADDILSNRFMAPASETLRVASVALSGLAAGAAATLLPAWWATGVTLLIVGGFGWLATLTLGSGLWLNLSQPVLAATTALFLGVAYQYFVEGREKRKMKKLFGQYVSKDVYDQLVANPELARLGGNRRHMTVLFSDIRGFTSVSERGQPEEIVQILNEYFTRMVDLVFAHKGTLDKFVGDMVMALFGAPLDDPRHADHAVECALDMVAELQKLNERWRGEGRPELDIGIGINSGPMIAGNIGSSAIMSYTVIGDAVNLGSRLESLNKQYGTRIIISASTRALLTGRFQCRPLGEVVVKGKTQPVAIFEVVGRESEAPGGEAGAGLTGSHASREARV